MRRRLLPASQAVAIVLTLFVGISYGSSPAAETAKNRLVQAVSRLDRYLTKDGANGRAWKRYLLWDDLQRALGPSDDLERRRIEAVYDRFRAGHRGLELAVFRDVALALRVYFDETSPPIDALPALARSAKEHFIARTPADLARAKRPLVQALGRLDRYLSPAGANGRAWKRFLMWDNLQRELAAQGGPDYVALDAVYHRFHSDHVGLELPVFRDVAQTLWAYRHLAEQVSNAGFHAEFEAHLEMLAKGLADYRQDAEAPLESIGEALGWLQRHRQALDVVRAIRAHLSQPNLYAQVSQGLIAAGSGRTVDETAPVRDFILGTSISGTGRTVGTASLRLVPDPHRAVIETVLDATNHSRTVGHNGPAIIFSAGETRITGCKRLVIDADGARGAPAKSSARTRTRVTGVGSTKRRLMGRIVRRVAQKRIPSQKSAGEQIAARHAEGTFNARLEAEVGATLSNANQTFQQRFRNPLVRRGEFPRLLRFSTTEDALRVEGLHDGPARLAAPSPPPDVSGRPDLALRLHESLVNNFATGLLAGRTIDKDQAERIALDIAGALPPQLQDDAGREPWAIEFAGPQPISLRIEKDRVTLTIRGRRFKSDRRVFDYPMNSTVGYRLENAGGAVKAVREGEVEVFPPDFVPGQGGQLSLRQSTLRNLLKRRFDKIFTPEIVSQGLVFPGRMRRAGKLDLTQLQADRGWLTLAWRRRATNHEAPK